MGTQRKQRSNCKACNKLLSSLKTIYCDNVCQGAFHFNNYIERWKRGEESGSDANGELNSRIKKYIRNKFSNKCFHCNWNEVNPATGTSPLAVDHIDGNFTNNVESNLRLLCPNCHSLTPTYGALNTGFGRPRRRKQYISDRSSMVES